MRGPEASDNLIRNPDSKTPLPSLMHRLFVNFGELAKILTSNLLRPAVKFDFSPGFPLPGSSCYAQRKP